MRSIERVEGVEHARRARFRLRVSDPDTLEALKRLVSAASYALDPVAITVRRSDAEGVVEVEVQNADVTVYRVTASEVRPAYPGDEWGEFVFFPDEAVAVKIGSACFLAFDRKLYACAAGEEEEVLRRLSLRHAAAERVASSAPARKRGRGSRPRSTPSAQRLKPLNA
jgi:hypothetical protein